MKILCVIDMQNDFIDGALGTPEAVKIVDNVREKIEKYRKNGDTVIFTRDTHYENYMDTAEGKNLPVPHCIKNTVGWQISAKLEVGDSKVIDKPTFGSTELGEYVSSLEDAESIELIGLCTDICVISNAMLVKAFYPEIPLTVDARACAGVTPQSHKNALDAMKMCQVKIINV